MDYPVLGFLPLTGEGDVDKRLWRNVAPGSNAMRVTLRRAVVHPRDGHAQSVPVVSLASAGPHIDKRHPRSGPHIRRVIPAARADATIYPCLLYTSPSPRDRTRSRMPSSA